MLFQRESGRQSGDAAADDGNAFHVIRLYAGSGVKR